MAETAQQQQAPTSTTIDDDLIKQIPKVVQELRNNFMSQKPETKKLDWRMHQVKQLRKMMVENDEKWKQALCKDLGTSTLMKGIETSGVVNSLDHMLENIPEWVKPKAKNVDFIAHKPGSAYITYDPFGVVCFVLFAHTSRCLLFHHGIIPFRCL